METPEQSLKYNLLDAESTTAASSHTKKRNLMMLGAAWVVVCVGAAVAALVYLTPNNDDDSSDSTTSRTRLMNKPGTCPTPTGFGLCAEFCFSDASCAMGMKCCSNGCGHQCMTVVEQSVCCEAMTSGCRSCKLGLSEEEFCNQCQQGLNDAGCATCIVVDEAPVTPRFCCEAMIPECFACKRGLTIDEFCRQCLSTGENSVECASCPAMAVAMARPVEHCGGIAGFVCSRPSDVCVYADGCNGMADCMGVCKPAANAEEPAVPRFCCEAMIPQCFACKRGLTIEQFCNQCRSTGENSVECASCPAVAVAVTRPVEHCGGIAGFVCSRPSDVCVYGDDCNPRTGGADCMGVCTPVDSERVCCEAMTVGCRSCKLGLSEEEFCNQCQQGLSDDGCSTCIAVVPQEPRREHCGGFAGLTCSSPKAVCVIPRGCADCMGTCVYREETVCCEAMTAECAACKLGVSKDEFCQSCHSLGSNALECRTCAN